MTDFLDKLAADAKATVELGYYDHAKTAKSFHLSLKTEILQSKKAAVIAEVKGASPSKGTIRQNFEPDKIAQAMARGGAAGISVLTEPKHFSGSLENLEKIRKNVAQPILMKDIIVDPAQLTAAAQMGANAILLIQAVFDRNYCSLNVDEMITKAHSKNLEVLLETHSTNEFQRAAQTEADLIGINNRNLGTLLIDLMTTKNILSKYPNTNKVIVSESGINTPKDLIVLREYGAHAFLIGSAIMMSEDIEAKVSEFVNA